MRKLSGPPILKKYMNKLEAIQNVQLGLSSYMALATGHYPLHGHNEAVYPRGQIEPGSSGL